MMELLRRTGSSRQHPAGLAGRLALALVLAFPSRALVAQSLDYSRAATGSAAENIRFAVLPLPEHLRDGATVMRMDSANRPVIVRQGSNGMVCMRVMPGEAAWDARCYETTIARLIFRAGELIMSGLTVDSLGPRLEAEARAGTLALPKHPVAAYRALGPEGAYVPATGAVTDRMAIWQSLHVPFVTAEAMGLPDESTVSLTQRGSVPYVVASGTWWAHIMLEPTRAHATLR